MYILHLQDCCPWPSYWAHKIYTTYAQILIPGQVTVLSSCIYNIHATFIYWTSHISYTNTFCTWRATYQTYTTCTQLLQTNIHLAQLLCSYYTYNTLGSRYILYIYIVTGFICMVWYISPTYTVTLWPSNWAYIIHMPHSRNSHCPVNGLKSYMYHMYIYRQLLSPGSNY